MAVLLLIWSAWADCAYAVDRCEPLFVTASRTVELVQFQGLRSQQELESLLGLDLRFQIDGRDIDVGPVSVVAPHQRVAKMSARPEAEQRLLKRLWSRATGDESRRLWIEDQAIVRRFRRQVLELEESYRDQLAAYAQELGLTIRGVSQLLTLVEHQWPFAWKAYVEPGVTKAQIDRLRNLNETKPTPVERESVDPRQFNGIEVGLLRVHLSDGQAIEKEVGSSATSSIDFADVEKALRESVNQVSVLKRNIVGVEFYHNHPAVTHVSPLSGPDAYYMTKLSDDFAARYGSRVPFTVHALHRAFGQLYLFSAQF